MRRIVLSSAFSCVAMAMLTACGGDDTEVPLDGGNAPADAGPDVTVVTNDSGPDAEPDAADATSASDAAEDAPDAADAAPSGPGFLLVSYAFDEFQKSELDAVNLATGQTAGRFSYGSGGTNVATSTHPWVLEQFNDVVARMNPAQPWMPLSTWNVASRAPDAGGYAYGNAYSVAENASSAYVALYNRNHVPVLDTSVAVDGGAPASSIDLSSLLQPGDGDGSVEDTAAIYDPSTKRVWLVLGNIDELTVAPPSYDLLCVPSLKSTVVAIDTTTNTLVSGLKYELTGVNPTSVQFDAPNERLIIMSAGCNRAPDAGSDAGPGALEGRLIEQIDLNTGISTVLYEATTQPYPGQLAYVQPHLAFVSFGSSTYAWDPTLTVLGAPIANAPEAWVWNGTGLLGPHTTYLADGGVSNSIVSVNPLTGEATIVEPSPFSVEDPSGYVEGIGLWNP
jgi:hypothetical protein